MNNRQNTQKKERKRLALPWRICIAVAVSILGMFLVGWILGNPATVAYPEKTNYAYIGDYGGKLSDATEDFVREQAAVLEAKYRIGIYVAVLPNSYGRDLTAYTDVLARQWKLNGNDAIIVFTTDDAHACIKYSSGLSTVLNEEQCQNILNAVSKDAMQAGNWDKAVTEAWTALAKVIYRQKEPSIPADLLAGPGTGTGRETVADAYVPLPPNAGTWSMILQLAKQLGLFWAACAALYLLYRMMRGIFHWSGWGSADTGSGGNWAAYGPFGGGASSASNGGGSGSAGAGGASV